MLYKKFYTWLIIGLMKDLTRLLNELIPENTTQEDKETVSDLNYEVIEFPVQEKDFSKIETKNNI